MSRHIVLFLLLVYLVLGALFAVTTPPWQNPDEPAHYNYIAYVAQEWALPVLNQGDYDQEYLQQLKERQFPPDLPIEPVRYEFHQPPLYYISAAPVFWLTGGSLLALRLFNVLIGAGVVWLIYTAARTVFPRRLGIPLSAAAFAAFLPMHVAMMASVNNDPLSELIVGAAMVVLLRWTRDVTGPPEAAENKRVSVSIPDQAGDRRATAAPARPPIRARQLILLGVLTGLGLLTKATAYVLLPVAVLTVSAVLFSVTRAVSQEPRPAPLSLTLLGNNSLLLAPALLLGLPLWIRNMSIYGNLDLLGLDRHGLVVTGQPTTLDWITVHGWADYWQRAWEFTFKSFWGVFGWLGVFMGQPVYTVLLLFTAIVIGGFSLGLLRLRGGRERVFAEQPWQWFSLALLLLATCAAYIWYNLGFVQHQGRYLFPALLPISLLIALGWRETVDSRQNYMLAVVPLVWLAVEMWNGLRAGDLNGWTLLLLAASALVLVVHASLNGRAPWWSRLRPFFLAAPFLFLILLDATIPFLYIGPVLN